MAAGSTCCLPRGRARRAAARARAAARPPAPKNAHARGPTNQTPPSRSHGRSLPPTIPTTQALYGPSRDSRGGRVLPAPETPQTSAPASPRSRGRERRAEPPSSWCAPLRPPRTRAAGLTSGLASRPPLRPRLAGCSQSQRLASRARSPARVDREQRGSLAFDARSFAREQLNAPAARRRRAARGR